MEAGKNEIAERDKVVKVYVLMSIFVDQLLLYTFISCLVLHFLVC